MISKNWCLFLSCVKRVQKSIYTSVLIFLQILLFSELLFAKENAEDAVNVSVGSTLARIGLGVATDGDSSVVDINPALLSAIEKQYSIFGSTNFNSGLDTWEFGILDSKFTPIAAVLKVRQTTHSTTEIDRIFRLGLSHNFQKTNLSLGISGTYFQQHVTKWFKSETSGGSVGVGALYQINFKNTNPLRIGLSILNILDRYQKTSFNLGFSKDFFNEMYTIHIDTSVLAKYRHPKLAGGFDVQFRKFFYLRGSIGWDFQAKVLPVGGGIYFNGPRLKAFYSIATHQVFTKGIWQSIGLIVTL